MSVRRFGLATLSAALLLGLLATPHTRAAGGSGDWPMWGGTPIRNMVSDMRGLPVDLGHPDEEERALDGDARLAEPTATRSSRAARCSSAPTTRACATRSSPATAAC